MQADALKAQAEEKRRAERRQRHLQDDLRYAFKKLEKPIDVNLSYDEVWPHNDSVYMFTTCVLGCAFNRTIIGVQGSR